MSENDIKNLKFHIKSDDYFGTLATILSLTRQTLVGHKSQYISLKKIENDLMFLQNKYKIVKKSNKKEKIKI